MDPDSSETAAASRHRAVQIRLTRAEGPVHSLHEPRVFDGANPWAGAHAQLVAWGLTAPSDGSVDKTDFTIVYDDGATYEGTFGLTQNHPDLPGHMRDHFEACLEYADVLPDVDPGDVRRFLDSYEIGPADPDPSAD